MLLVFVRRKERLKASPEIIEVGLAHRLLVPRERRGRGPRPAAGDPWVGRRRRRCLLPVLLPTGGGDALRGLHLEDVEIPAAEIPSPLPVGEADVEVGGDEQGALGLHPALITPGGKELVT